MKEEIKTILARDYNQIIRVSAVEDILSVAGKYIEKIERYNKGEEYPGLENSVRAKLTRSDLQHYPNGYHDAVKKLKRLIVNRSQ